MKILVVVDNRLPSFGGAELQAMLLARSLQQRGHYVELLAPRFDRREPVCDEIQGVPLRRVGYPRVRLFGAAILAARFAWLLAFRYRSFDAVHVHTARILAAAAGFMRRRSRWTLTVKVSGAYEFFGGILDAGLASSPVNRLLNRYIRRADTIQAISTLTRSMLLKAGYSDEQIRMIPNGVDVAKFEQAARCPTNGVPSVVYVGRFVPVKALDVLLDAWSRIDRRHGANLRLIGDGAIRADLERQAERLRISDSVTFVGQVSDVARHLASADIYVQSSHQEGLPNSVLEAMACGLPVVATRVGGTEDLVVDHENGLLVPPGDAESLARALEQLLQDCDVRQRMGRRSRDTIMTRYELGRVLEQLERVYGTPRTA